MTQALPSVAVSAVPAVSALAAVTPLSGSVSPGEGGAAFGRELERATRRNERGEAQTPAAPATPATPARSGTPATPATPASPAQAATAAERSAADRRGAAERARAHEARDARRARSGTDAEAGEARRTGTALDASALDDESSEDGTAPAEPGLPTDLASLLPQLAERLQANRPAPAPRGAPGQPESEPAAGAALPGLAAGTGELARGLVDERARDIPQTRLDPAAAAADTADATGTTSAAAFGALVAEAAQAAATARPAAETARVDALLSPASAGHGVAASQAAAAPAPTPTPTVTEDRLSAPLGTRDFAQELGARVVHFAKGGIEHARLNLNPAELGPIALQLALDGTQLRVDMSAALAATRQALEQALPGLAGALAEAGLTLSGGGVFEQARGEAGNARGGQPGRVRAGADTGTDEAAPAMVTRPVRLDGLVDLYA